MLHTPSFNMGLAAGITAVASNVPRPTKLAEIPGIDAILDASQVDGMFFPSSYAEGFITAYDNKGHRFIL